MRLGQRAEHQTFVGGLRLYELSGCPQFWSVGMTQTGRPLCQTGNTSTPAGASCALDWAKSRGDHCKNAVWIGTGETG